MPAGVYKIASGPRFTASSSSPASDGLDRAAGCGCRHVFSVDTSPEHFVPGMSSHRIGDLVLPAYILPPRGVAAGSCGSGAASVEGENRGAGVRPDEARTRHRKRAMSFM